MEDFRLQVRQHLESVVELEHPRVFADLRGLKPLPTPSQLAIVVLNRRALEFGVRKIFVAHSCEQTRLQFEKLAKMGSAYHLERHVDVTQTPDWEASMRDWFAESA